MSQFQGDSAPTKLMETGDIVRLALWSPLLNRTRCGISFMVGDERVWLKQVFGPPYNHITECNHGECPCDWHEPKQP